MAVAFPDARHGWAVGWGGDILVTSDGGAHWRVQRDIVEDLFLSDVTFADARHGWIVGGGFILATSDGGRRWHTQLPGTHDVLNSVLVCECKRRLGRR